MPLAPRHRSGRRGLALFGLPFAVNSSLHSYLILAYAGSEKAAEDVGFYYAANATGRLMGIVAVRGALSGRRHDGVPDRLGRDAGDVLADYVPAADGGANIGAASAPGLKDAMSTFERYLTLWVALCIVVGIALGDLMPSVFQAIGGAEIAKVNLPVAVLIWLMIVPMLLKIDFAALGRVREHWRGIGVTLFINWAIKPFSMALLGWLFIGYLFRPYLPADQINCYIAGLIILAAAPCTAMVFVWSNLTNGEPHFTLSPGRAQRRDHGRRLCAPSWRCCWACRRSPCPGRPWCSSVVLYIVVPVIVAQILRRSILRQRRRGGAGAPAGAVSAAVAVALLATLVLLFGFQGEQIIAQPLVIAAAGRADPDPGLFQRRLRLSAQPPWPASSIASPGLGADRRQQLLRTGGRRRHQPVRLQFRRRAGDRRRRADRGPGHAVGGLDRESQQGLVRARRQNKRFRPPEIYIAP